MATAAATKPKAASSLYEALLGVQKAAIKLDLPKTGYNPHHKSKYMPLDVVLGQVVPLLNDNGFILIQAPSFVEVDGCPPAGTLKTEFVFVPTSESIKHEMLLSPGRADPQGQGAAVTYAKRYAIMSILGLTSDEDDDGNSSSRKPPSVVNESGDGAAAEAEASEVSDDPFASNSDSPF